MCLIRKNCLDECEKSEIIKMYNKGYSTVMIANKLNRCDSTIGRFLKRNSLNRTYRKNKILKEDEKDIVNLYRAGLPAKDILPRYADRIKCENTIINILKRNNCDIRPRGVPTYFNKRYFKVIDTEAKAYFLGLLLTDGNVYKAKRRTPQYRIQISLKYDDIEIIEKFKEELNATTKISHYIKNGRNECIFGVHSKEMAADLALYGICERKTFNTELSSLVPKELYPHYIRGVFDGDGTVFLSGKYKSLTFGFYGTHKLVSQVKQYLTKQIHISDNSIFDKETVSFITFSKIKDVKNFYNLLYSDSHFYLRRKKNVFEKYLKDKGII